MSFWEVSQCHFSVKKRLPLISMGSKANFIITARKRSFGQGNIFTPLCHSVHGGGGRVPGPGGCLVRGGCLVQGGAWSGGCLVPWGGCLDGDPPDSYWCGWCASYWNAFLFKYSFGHVGTAILRNPGLRTGRQRRHQPQVFLKIPVKLHN